MPHPVVFLQLWREITYCTLELARNFAPYRKTPETEPITTDWDRPLPIVYNISQQTRLINAFVLHNPVSSWGAAMSVLSRTDCLGFAQTAGLAGFCTCLWTHAVRGTTVDQVQIAGRICRGKANMLALR